jgi:hypothetical protein
MKNKTIVKALVLIVMLSTVSYASETIKQSSVVTAFNDLMMKEGLLTFRSWNGKLFGKDSDTDITFLPEHRVRMIEYGYVMNSYEGTYLLHANGEVTTKFNGFGHEWPVMILQQDSVSLLLRPKDPTTGFQMGHRAGATILGDQGTYWPFRPVSTSEKSDIKQRP